MGLPSAIAMRPARITFLVCGIAAVLTLTLTLTSVPRLRGSDVPFLLFAVAPYAVSAALATRLRRSRRWGWSLLALTVALSLAGVGCFAVDSWSFHTVPEYRMVQRFTVIAAPMLQLAALAPFAAAALVWARR